MTTPPKTPGQIIYEQRMALSRDAAPFADLEPLLKLSYERLAEKHPLEKCCVSCVFYFANWEWQGECRASRPGIPLTWPKVNPDAWCGEFAPVPTPHELPA